MDAFSDAKDVARICGVPDRRGVTEMCLRGEKQLERDVRRPGRVREQRVRLVVRFRCTANGLDDAFCTGPLSIKPLRGG